MKKITNIFKRSGQQSNIKKSASNDQNETHQKHIHAVRNTLDAPLIYQCPMKCEGDKTYSNPGKCPDCGMFLVPVNEESHNM